MAHAHNPQMHSATSQETDKLLFLIHFACQSHTAQKRSASFEKWIFLYANETVTLNEDILTTESESADNDHINYIMTS